MWTIDVVHCSQDDYGILNPVKGKCPLRIPDPNFKVNNDLIVKFYLPSDMTPNEEKFSCTVCEKSIESVFQIDGKFYDRNVFPKPSERIFHMYTLKYANRFSFRPLNSESGKMIGVSITYTNKNDNICVEFLFSNRKPVRFYGDSDMPFEQTINMIKFVLRGPKPGDHGTFNGAYSRMQYDSYVCYRAYEHSKKDTIVSSDYDDGLLSDDE